MLQHLASRLIAFVLIALIVTAALVVYADAGDFVDALGEFSWWVTLPIIALVCANYALRFLKWHFYLGQIDADKNLSLLTSLLIFLSGLAMVITPAKAGEWIKSYLLRSANGTPVTRSAAVVFAERITDGLSVLLLSLTGLLLFQPSYWPFFAVVAAILLGLFAAIRIRPLAHRILAALGRLPLLNRAAQHLDEIYESTYRLFAPWPLLVAAALGFVGWGCEAAGLYLVVYGLTSTGDLDILVKSAFIMGVASLAGALFIVPGGLGVSETGITGLGRTLLDLSREAAAAATIIIRFFTLWFGVAVGLIALALVARRLPRHETEEIVEATL